MRSLKSSNNLYLKAGSLIESSIAITVITVCLFIALKLYIMVINTDSLLTNETKQYQVDRLIAEIKQNKNFESEIYQFKNYTIRKKVSNYENRSNLLKISLLVETKSDTITYSYLVLNNNEQK